MIENLHNTQFVYGSWGQLFGCWYKPDLNSTAIEIVPRWPFLSANGAIETDHVAFRKRFGDRDYLRSTKHFKEEQMLFYTYYAAIPLSIRSLVAPFRQDAWLLLDLIWQVPAFAQFFDQEVRKNDGHFVIAVLALSEAHGKRRGDRRRLALEIMEKKRPQVIKMLRRKVKHARPFITALHKVSKLNMPRDFYEDLLKASVDPHRSRALSSLKGIDDESLGWVLELPRELLIPKYIAALCVSLGENDNLGALAINFNDIPTDLKCQVLDALNNARDQIHVLRLAERWSNRIYERMQFPKPPLNPHSQLVPLSSAIMMRQEAIRMQNCLSGLIGDVIDGQVYFYRWNRPDPVNLKIKRISKPGGHPAWELSAAFGFGNEHISSEDFFKAAVVVRSLTPPSYNVPAPVTSSKRPNHREPQILNNPSFV